MQVRQPTSHVTQHPHAGLGREGAAAATGAKLEGRVQGTLLGEGIHQAADRPVRAESQELEEVGMLELGKDPDLSWRVRESALWEALHTLQLVGSSIVNCLASCIPI